MKFILIITISLKTNDDVIGKIVLLGTVYVLHKLSSYVQELFQDFRVGRE